MKSGLTIRNNNFEQTSVDSNRTPKISIHLIWCKARVWSNVQLLRPYTCSQVGRHPDNSHVTPSQLQCQEAFVSRMQVRLCVLDIIRTIIIQCTWCYQDKLSEQSGKWWPCRHKAFLTGNCLVSSSYCEPWKGGLNMSHEYGVCNVNIQFGHCHLPTSSTLNLPAIFFYWPMGLVEVSLPCWCMR